MNTSVLEANVTLEQIASAFNLNISNSTNDSALAVTPEKLFSLYEAYRTKEREQLMLYKSVAYVLGTLIILSNLTVVISSGLILRKGQQPKSTYLLLGNVSLADTIIGVSIIFGTLVDNAVNSNVLCIFQIGMIVCPTMVSIFSVGLIAIDRYIYIIHGLYYQRWINTTRVRIGILIIWLVGLILGFMPATGWINQELRFARCSYISVFPGGLIFINSILSIIPIIVVAVLYTIILIRALKNVGNIRSAKKQSEENSISEKPKLRIYRSNINNNKIPNLNHSVKFPVYNKSCLTRSASTSALRNNDLKGNGFNGKSKSTDKLNSQKDVGLDDTGIKTPNTNESKLSIWSVESDNNASSSHNPSTKCNVVACSAAKFQYCKTKLVAKSKEAKKFRAVMVVMLTSGSFLVSWIPFIIVVNFYVFCEDKVSDSRCLKLRAFLGGPLATLAYLNSVFNPLIYAWWHRGFQNAVKTYFKKFYLKKNVLPKPKPSKVQPG